MKPILCCDLDSVLADTDSAVLARMNDDFGTTFHPRDQTQWFFEHNLHGIHPNPEGYMQGMFADPEFFANLPLILPMYVVLRKIKQHFSGLHIVTSRAPEMRAVTVRWLDSYGINYDKLIMTHDKAQYCFEQRAGYHIEDAPHHAEAVHARGIGVFLIDKPYNQGMEPRGGLWRVHNPIEIIPLLRADLTRSAGSSTSVAPPSLPGDEAGSV